MCNRLKYILTCFRKSTIKLFKIWNEETSLLFYINVENK